MNSAAGVDMGRSIFQSDCPTGMLQAASKIVHEGMAPIEAFDLYSMIKRTWAEPQPTI